MGVNEISGQYGLNKTGVPGGIGVLLDPAGRSHRRPITHHAARRPGRGAAAAANRAVARPASNLSSHRARTSVSGAGPARLVLVINRFPEEPRANPCLMSPTGPPSRSSAAMRGCSPAGRPSLCGMLRCSRSSSGRSSGMMPWPRRPRLASGLRCSRRACPALSGRRNGTSTRQVARLHGRPPPGMRAVCPAGYPVSRALLTRRAGHLITEEMLWPWDDAAMRKPN
jgi:hypothetical protein